MKLAKVARPPEKFRINKILLIKSVLLEAVFDRDLTEVLDNFSKVSSSF